MDVDAVLAGLYGEDLVGGGAVDGGSLAGGVFVDAAGVDAGSGGDLPGAHAAVHEVGDVLGDGCGGD